MMNELADLRAAIEAMPHSACPISHWYTSQVDSPKPACGQYCNRRVALAALDALEKRLLQRVPTLLDKPPCFICGYNGPEYFQRDKHPCMGKLAEILDSQ